MINVITKLIEVVPYNPNWPKMFDAEASAIKQALGDNCVEVHHIGSTAVAGLIAKPIIDIISVVHDPKNSINSLEAIGYNYRGEMNIPFRFFFTKKPTMHLHVYESNSPEIELNLLFRDHLRKHQSSCAEYACLKENLLNEENHNQKIFGVFSGYNLGKDAFIRKILEASGFDKLRLMRCTHYAEWETYHRIREEQIFSPLNITYDPNHPTIHAVNHFHFVLYKGIQIVTVAHVEFFNDTEAALRSIATDEPYKKQGFGKSMMELLEQWIKNQGKQVVKMHSNLRAEGFYRKLGYTEMPFDDQSISQEIIDFGKVFG